MAPRQDVLPLGHPVRRDGWQSGSCRRSGSPCCDGATVRDVTAVLEPARGGRLRYRWDVDSFARAWEAGAFDGHRVELVDGEVWSVGIGDWHGLVPPLLVLALQRQGRLRQSSLPSDDSLPDPDLWVGRHDARPRRMVSERISSWDADDVLLVVEVGDETLAADLSTKAALYARSGYARYWVVSRRGVHEHTSPSPEGYRQVRLHVRGERVPLPDGTEVAVDDLLPDEDEA